MRRESGYLLVVVASLAACSRCGERPAAGPRVAVEDLLPASASAVALVPSIWQAATAARGLARAVVRFPEGETIGGILDALDAQLGFDPADTKALKRAGIDARRPAGVAFEGGEPWFAVPIADEAAFRSTTAKLAAGRLGADKSERHGDVTVFSSAGGPAAALGFSGDYGVVASGPTAEQEVVRALARKKEERLSQDPLFRKAIPKLGSGWDIEWYLPAGSAYLPVKMPAGQAFAAGLSYGNGRLAGRLVALLSVAEGAGLSGFAMAAGQPLVTLLPPMDPVFARAGGDPGRLYGVWQAVVPGAIGEALTQAKIDVEKDILGNLQPGIVLALGLAPHLDLSAAPSLDPRVQNPFRFVTLDAFGKVRDQKAARATLGKLSRLPGNLGLTTSHREVAGTDVTTFHYELGEGPSIALVGDTLAVTGGESEMEGALARVSRKAPGYVPPPWMRRALLGSVSDGAALDTTALRQAIEAIPPTAFGGLTGLTLRALIRRFSNPLMWLGPISATVEVGPDALEADAELVFR